MAHIDASRFKLSQLRALVAIADWGTFGKAALHLDLSQSAVSHAIATLEETLGVVLLHRGRQGAVLTPVGADIAQEARQVLAALERIGQTAVQARGLEAGQVRVACFRSVATHLLPQLINQFQQRYPDIKVTLTEYYTTENIEEALQQGRADIGFILLPTENSALETWEILRDEYVVLLPPSEPHFAQTTWEQLMQYPMILPPRHVTCCRIVQDYFEVYNRPFNIAYEITEDSTVLSMVMQGLGISIMARLAAEPIPPSMQVASLPEPLERIIGVAIATDTFQTPAVYAFLDVLKHAKASIDQRSVA